MNNLIRNGDFFEWPNGTSFPVVAGTITTPISGDLSFVKSGASQPVVTISRQQHAVNASIRQGFPTYFLRVAPSTAPALGATDKSYLTYTYSEALDRLVAQGAYGHFSFWAKSSVNREVAVRFYRTFGSGGSNNNGNTSEVLVTKSIQLTTGWKKYQIDCRFPAFTAAYGAGATVEARIYLQGGATELGTQAVPWTTATVDLSQVALTLTQIGEDFSTTRLSSASIASVTTIYVTDPAFGAVGNYTGAHTRVGTGTDNRAAIQAALDSAYTPGSLGRDDYLGNTSHRVVIPKGKYYISAPPDGMPSLQIPLGVELDFSEAELHFDLPPCDYTANGITEPNPAWCCILAGPLANIRVGTMQIAAGKSQTYGGTWFGYTLDGIRVQESDVGWIVGGGGERYIYNFGRGAGIRILASYDMHVSNLNFGSSGYGIVMGYLGNAFNAYTLYRGGSDAERVSTSLWVDNCVFRNMYRSGIVTGAGGDWHNPSTPDSIFGGLETIVADGRSEQGGPISINQCSMEQVAFGAILARCNNSSLFINDLRLEECQENTTALGTVYSNGKGFKVNGFYFGSTGTRVVTLGHYGSTDTTGTIIPRLVFHCDGVNTSPLLQNLFIPISAINSTKLLTLSSAARLPTIINYQAGATTQMQGTDSSVKNIIFDNDGGRISSVSTTGLKPTEAVGAGRTTFTFTNGFTPQRPQRILVDGLELEATDAAGTNWTWDSATGIITLAVAPTKNVRAFF